MNCIYKTVFNRRLNVWQVASEIAAGRGKSSCSVGMTGALALALGAFALPAWSAACTVGGVTYSVCTSGADGGGGGTEPSTAGGSGSQPGSNNGGAGGGLSSHGSNGQGSNGGDGGVTASNAPALGGGAGSVATDGRGGGGGGGEGSETHIGGGGGGGGSGGAVLSVQTTYAADTAVLGGNGGAGGAAYDSLNVGGGGGGGGGGGTSVVLLANRLDTSAYIRGGDGGAGGEGVVLNAGLSQPGQAQAGLYSGGGGAGGAGGAGIVGDFSAVTELINRGTVRGGTGGAAGITATAFSVPMGGAGGAGGSAITGTGAGLMVRNEGSLLGGNGGASAWMMGSSSPQGSAGGHGIAGDSWSIDNSGTISGGAGGNGLANAGLWTFGTVGGDGGSGIAGNDLTITNTGTVSGGQGGNGGTGYMYSFPIMGANDPGDGGAGGSGMAGAGLTLLNRGTISGGAGGAAGEFSAHNFRQPMSGAGGTGVSGTDLNVTNEGAISGGLGGYKGGGGSGISATGASTITNSGTITGGHGRTNILMLGISGGSGISGSGLTLVNTGTIRGGRGGDGIFDALLYLPTEGGKGGSGLSLSGNSTVTTSGLIAGGEGGIAQPVPPEYEMYRTDGAQGDAVKFSGGGNTLTLEQGFSFIGNVLSTSGSVNGDTLALGGSTNAATAFDVSNIVASLPASYSGTQYVGFSQFQKTGTSSWTLTGTGRASTHWTIVQGTLRGDASALAGNITFAPTSGNSAAVVFDQGSSNTNSPTNAIYAGAISGNGSLGKTGDGSLILTGDHSYSGGTIISGGTLQIGNGGTSGSVVGDILNNGVLVFDRSDASSLAGAISGNGLLVKRGAGALAITGTNSDSGDTRVEAGILQFTSYTQSASQTLGIAASSTSDYGKLAVTGAATFAAGSRIDVDVASVNTLAQGATLRSVVTAGTLSASTFSVTDNSTLFNFAALVNGNALDLMAVSSVSVSETVTADGFQSAAGAAQVLDAIMSGTPSGDMAAVVHALGQLGTSRDVARAAAQTLPVGTGTQAVQGVLSSFGQVLQGRLGSTGLSAGDALLNQQVWGKSFGSRADQNSQSGTAGFAADTGGLALGVDAEVSPGSRVGLAYGYAKTRVTGHTDVSGTGQNADIATHVLALYGNTPMAADLDLVYQADVGLSNNKGSRFINFGGLNRVATSSYQTHTLHAGVGLNKTLTLSEATTFIPGVRADYVWLRSEAYSETGAGGLNLNVAGNTTEALLLGADARLVHRLDARSSLSANVGLAYDTINQQGLIVSNYAGAPGLSFSTTGMEHSPWLMRAGMAYSHKTAAGTDLALRYDAEGRDGFIHQVVSVKATWAF
jgi:autotransporter family porin